MADEKTDALYASLRHRGGKDARSNGYVNAGFFSREQAFLLSRLKVKPGARVLDLCCGSGLMLGPVADRLDVVGLDFNAEAAAQAQVNGLVVVRGDAFSLPFQTKSFDALCCCQFLNQQVHDHQQPLLVEAARILRPGGSFHLMWRNGRSLVHRGVHGAFSIWRRASGQPIFPQYFHAPKQLVERAVPLGFTAVELKITLPIGPGSVSAQSPLAGLVGASFYLELTRDQD